MLPFPDLSGKSFEETVNEAIKNIERYTDIWKGAGVHDPGVMLIELFAWLNVERRQKINSVGIKSLSKLLSFAGISLNGAKAAAINAVLNAEKDTTVPAGTKFRFEDIVFETTKKYRILNNRIIWHNGGSAFNGHGETEEFIIHLEKPLPKGQTIALGVELKSAGGVVRNPVIDEASFSPTSIIKWEYYGEKEGRACWCTAEIIKDTTFNLLFTGNVVFKINEKHLPYNGAYVIRGVLVRDLYEVKPKIRRAFINCLPLTQTDTKCIPILFNAGEVRKNEMMVNHFLAFSGAYDLYVKPTGQWLRAEDAGLKYTLAIDGDSDGAMPRLLISHYGGFVMSCGSAEDSENVLKLVLYDADFYAKKTAGVGNGFSGQVIVPPVKGVTMPLLELTVIEDDGMCRVYKPVSSLDGSDQGDEHFIFNEYDGIIRFGNNEKGLAPPPGSQIIFTSLISTYGEQGNIKRSLLMLPELRQFFNGVSILGHTSAAGGKNAETIDELIARIPTELNKVGAAVTKSDYETIAKSAQGLMIKNAVALPLYEPESRAKAENTVTVVIEPYTESTSLPGTAYLKNVITALESKRLLATRVFAVYPRYVGIEVYCEAIFKERSAEPTSELIDKIKLQAEKAVNDIPLGRAVTIAGVRAAIESLSGVAYTKYLHMEFFGEAKRNVFGDIELLPHAKAYLKRADIRGVK